MAKGIRLKLNYRALGDAALRSAGTAAAVEAVAEQSAARARSRTGDEIVVTRGGGKRVRVYVERRGSGAAGEAADRALGSSL